MEERHHTHRKQKMLSVVTQRKESERDGQRERKRDIEGEKERGGLVRNARSTHLEELEKNKLRKKKKTLISARTKTKVPIRNL